MTDRHLAQSNLGETLAEFSDVGSEIMAELNSVILGQKNTVLEAFIALIAQGHILLEGSPGVGKTFMLKAIAKLSGLNMKRVQCTPELMPSDILGGTQLNQSPEGPNLHFHEGPIFTQIFFADEINRATPRTQAALLEAMGERQVSIEGEIRTLPRPFLVVATQNPLDHEGTYPLPEAQADRFFFKSLTPQPSAEHLDRLLDFNADLALKELHSMMNSNQIDRWSWASSQIPLSPKTRSNLLKLIMSTRREQLNSTLSPFIADSLSPRAARDLYRACQVHAALKGRLVANQEDLERCFLPSLRHRLRLTWRAQSNQMNSDQILSDLFKAILK